MSATYPYAAIKVTVRYGNGGYWDGTWKIAKLSVLVTFLTSYLFFQVTPDIAVDDFLDLVRNQVKKNDSDRNPWKRVTFQSFKLRAQGARSVADAGLEAKEYEIWDGEGNPPTHNEYTLLHLHVQSGVKNSSRVPKEIEVREKPKEKEREKEKEKDKAKPMKKSRDNDDRANLSTSPKRQRSSSNTPSPDSSGHNTSSGSRENTLSPAEVNMSKSTEARAGHHNRKHHKRKNQNKHSEASDDLDLDWQEAIDILENQQKKTGDTEEEQDEDLYVIAKRSLVGRNIDEIESRSSRRYQESDDDDLNEDVRVSSDEEDSRGDRALQIPKEKSIKTAAWEQLLSGMEQKAQQVSIELEWERALDRSERTAVEKSLEQAWEQSLDRIEATATARSQEEDWDRLMLRIERNAAQNTAKSEWEELLDFTERLAAKESMVHDWEVTLDEVEKRAQNKTVENEWEETLRNAEAIALKETEKIESDASNFDVSINIYDVMVDGTPLTALNDKTLRVGFGIFYSGIVYQGREYSYSQSTGVYNLRPRGLRQAVHRQTIGLGKSRGQDIEAVIKELEDMGFTAANYNVIKRNANHFTAELSKMLSGQTPPNWLNKMIRACRFLDVFLPQATFRSDLLLAKKPPSKAITSAVSADDDSVSLTEIKNVVPSQQEQKALSEWESALQKFDKSNRRVPETTPSDGEDSTETALEKPKAHAVDIKGSHGSHKKHVKGHAKSHSKHGTSASVNREKDRTAPEDTQSELKKSDDLTDGKKASTNSDSLEIGVDKSQRLQKQNSKAVLDKRVTNLQEQMSLLETKVDELKKRQSDQSKIVPEEH